MAGEVDRVQKALCELAKSIESLPADLSPKSVHKLRTAARRVESIAAALEAAHPEKSRRLVKAIEPIRKAAGQVRDTDVLVANARKLARYDAGESLPRLLHHLDAARRQSADELARVLRRRRKSAHKHLKGYSRFLASAWKRAASSPDSHPETDPHREKIADTAMSLLRELGDWDYLDAGNLHAYRLKVKQLRYTLQLDTGAAPGPVEALGDVQRRIGDWHDWRQLDEVARGVLTLEQDRPLLDRIHATAARRLTRALDAANALRRKYLAAPQAMGA